MTGGYKMWRPFLIPALLALAGCVAVNQPFTLATAELAAEKGNPKAQYYLAKCYAKGDGVPRDYLKSAALMRQAAGKNYPLAENDLGVYYAKGLGVPQDYVEAAKWYRRAAEKGDALAQYSLGLDYLRGRGLATNLNESLHWLHQAAKQEQPDALLVLGDIYRTGLPGVPSDPAAAQKYLKKAAARGRPGADNSLGLMFEASSGDQKGNLDQAFQYFHAAAENGDADGQMNLGQMYWNGKSVKTDRVTAYEWFYLAALSGNRLAGHFLMELDGRLPTAGNPPLSKSEVQEAVRRAETFLRSKMPYPVK